MYPLGYPTNNHDEKIVNRQETGTAGQSVQAYAEDWYHGGNSPSYDQAEITVVQRIDLHIYNVYNVNIFMFTSR